MVSLSTPVPTQESTAGPPGPKGGGTAKRARAFLRQCGMGIATLLLISVIAFAAMNHSPDVIARNVLGHGASSAQLAAYAAAHGLDQPLVIQYLTWLGHFLRGDWGTTLGSDQPVQDIVLPAFAHTSLLALTTLVWAVPLAILFGVSVARRGGASDSGAFVVMTVLAALPEFVVGLALMIIFAVQLGWFPVSSSAIDQGTLSEKVLALVLPSLALGLGVIPYVWRITRGSVLEAFSAPYTRTAVLRGLPRRRVVWRHSVRSASVPLVNAIALNIIYLMGGVIVIENVFAYPGLGRQLVHSIAQGDANTALAIIVLLGTVFIVLSLVADFVVDYLDPRLKGLTR